MPVKTVGPGFGPEPQRTSSEPKLYIAVSQLSVPVGPDLHQAKLSGLCKAGLFELRLREVVGKQTYGPVFRIPFRLDFVILDGPIGRANPFHPWVLLRCAANTTFLQCAGEGNRRGVIWHQVKLQLQMSIISRGYNFCWFVVPSCSFTLCALACLQAFLHFCHCRPCLLTLHGP